jgi:isopentenyl diphosphate isomerase/L-lactate dehydrogenase-like FMN-dependent dehydrogenase
MQFWDGVKAQEAIREKATSATPFREDEMNEAIRPARNVELGASSEEFQNLHEFIRKARANLNQNAWDYIVGAAETETTMRRNRMALDEIAFRPRVLRNVAKVDASVERFGRKMRLPVMLAPVGALEIFDPKGAAASVTRGAGRFGAAHMLSSVSEPGLEKVAEAAPDALRLFQLYVRGDDAFVEDHVSRAIASGYAAFCLTVDTAHYSRRERDIAKRYVRESRMRSTGGDFQKGLEWRTVKLIKDKYKIPLVLKGIATAEDAAIALDHGVEWIYVSNHGGRQLDHGRGAMHVLPEIVDAVKGRAKIMVDGGFCRGSDVVKAIAAGADIVGIGRMQCWALAAAGEAGVHRMLELLEDEVIRSLGLLGVTSFAELNKSCLHPATATNPPSVFSAFPLLEIEPYRY